MKGKNGSRKKRLRQQLWFMMIPLLRSSTRYEGFCLLRFCRVLEETFCEGDRRFSYVASRLGSIGESARRIHDLHIVGVFPRPRCQLIEGGDKSFFAPTLIKLPLLITSADDCSAFPLTPNYSKWRGGKNVMLSDGIQRGISLLGETLMVLRMKCGN